MHFPGFLPDIAVTCRILVNSVDNGYFLPPPKTIGIKVPQAFCLFSSSSVFSKFLSTMMEVNGVVSFTEDHRHLRPDSSVRTVFPVELRIQPLIAHSCGPREYSERSCALDFSFVNAVFRASFTLFQINFSYSGYDILSEEKILP